MALVLVTIDNAEPAALRIIPWDAVGFKREHGRQADEEDPEDTLWCVWHAAKRTGLLTEEDGARFHDWEAFASVCDLEELTKAEADALDPLAHTKNSVHE